MLVELEFLEDIDQQDEYWMWLDDDNRLYFKVTNGEAVYRRAWWIPVHGHQHYVLERLEI